MPKRIKFLMYETKMGSYFIVSNSKPETHWIYPSDTEWLSYDFRTRVGASDTLIATWYDTLAD